MFFTKIAASQDVDVDSIIKSNRVKKITIFCINNVNSKSVAENSFLFKKQCELYFDTSNYQPGRVLYYFDFPYSYTDRIEVEHRVAYSFFKNKYLPVADTIIYPDSMQYIKNFSVALMSSSNNYEVLEDFYYPNYINRYKSLFNNYYHYFKNKNIVQNRMFDTKGLVRAIVYIDSITNELISSYIIDYDFY